MVRGPLWPNVGQTGVSGRPPRPHQAGGGAFFIIEETRQYESGDNGGAVLKPLTPHMPARICRGCGSCYRATNRGTLAYSISPHCSDLYFTIKMFCFMVLYFTTTSSIDKYAAHKKTLFPSTVPIHRLILHHKCSNSQPVFVLATV